MESSTFYILHKQNNDMSEEPQTLKGAWQSAENKRRQIETSWETNTPAHQALVNAAISSYEQCLRIQDQIALFSPNESLEDIATNDLHHLLSQYRLADLVQRLSSQDRKAVLRRAQDSYEKFLRQLDLYDMLTSSDLKLLEQYRDSPTTFSTASTSDPAARRETKILRFKQEKDLKQKLQHLQQNPAALQNDDDMYRSLQLTQIEFCVHQTYQSLESIAQELHILSRAPPPPPPGQGSLPFDARERYKNNDGYSEKLDGPMSAGLSGPMLSKDGKPLRPFTLLNTRQTLKDGVFRPDHSLPTMTIDEYLDEEKRRGGMIEGGGAQSGIKPEVDEDDLDKADEETMKARAWDEYVEHNPKGSGNTLNRG
ncbi:phosphatase 2A-associated protein [Aureobasidium pullulans]|uniref:Phosphatase 2A-associated protein n=1 Tax=Aureobasidium pullulans TaxID=5580 RepID=A0A4S9Y8I5_AURPU|nr:phosphatase 2A-associated protein [Aureobasidium pullulans]